MITFAHILSPVKVLPSSDLYLAQPITFASMKEARLVSKESVKVEFFTAHYQEDLGMTEAPFVETPFLEKSILDLGHEMGKRKLPALIDILSRGYQASSADYIIYTNVDIGLKPGFYEEAARLVEMGYDSFTITRRTLIGNYSGIEDLDKIYQEKGLPHPGWDCFVFRRDILPKLLLDGIYLGVPPIGAVLVCNLLHFSKNFQCFGDYDLTFHLGDDGEWKKRKNRAEIFCRKAADAIFSKLLKMETDTTKHQVIHNHWIENRCALWHPALSLIGKSVKFLRRTMKLSF